MSTNMSTQAISADLSTVKNETFEADVLKSHFPVLVDFSAEWCTPCRRMHGVLSELATDLEGWLSIVTVDLDQVPVHAAGLGVKGMPSLFLFHKGKILAHGAGAAPKAVVRCWVAATLAKS